MPLMRIPPQTETVVVVMVASVKVKLLKFEVKLCKRLLGLKSTLMVLGGAVSVLSEARLRRDMVVGLVS